MPLSRDADYATYLYTCNRCRACTTVRDRPELLVCPSFDHLGFFAYSGGGKGYTAQGVLEGKVAPTLEAAKVAMHCTLCHACATMCPPGFETIHFIRDLRAWLVSHGVYANAGHRRVLENLRTKGNPWNLTWGQAPNLTLAAESNEVEALLFLGCRFKLSQSPLDGVLKIVHRAGAKVSVLEDEPCCGNPALELGDPELFIRLAEKTIARLNAAGAERIITLCPHCTSTMVNDYLEAGELKPEVIHLSEWIAELLAEGRIGLAETGPELSVSLHDPCHLTRYLERGEVLRQVLEQVSGLELREMERSGESAYCCGGGSFALEVAPELWRFASRERIREARASGAQALVTACPYCQASLSRAGGKRLEVIPLADLVAGRLD